MSAADTAARLRQEFYEKHRSADWLVFDNRTHQAIGAVYYAPDWWDTPEVHEKELRDFFSLVNAKYQEWLESPSRER